MKAKLFKKIRWIQSHPVKSALFFLIVVLGLPLILVIFVKDSGLIGDTFGGMTAPFINLLAAILVYISFNEQRKANRLQWKTLEDEKKRIEKQNTFELLYKFYADEIKHFEYLPGKYYYTLIDDSDYSNGLSQDYKLVIRNSMEYFDMINFFLEKLLKTDISEENKEVLIKLYYKSLRKFKSSVKIPPTDTNHFTFIQDHAKLFANTYQKNQKLMKELEGYLKSKRKKNKYLFR